MQNEHLEGTGREGEREKESAKQKSKSESESKSKSERATYQFVTRDPRIRSRASGEGILVLPTLFITFKDFRMREGVP